MFELDCLRAMALVERAGAGLDEADRLRLEEHLEGCTRCSADAALLGAVAGRLRAASSGLDAAARTRTFDRAWRTHAAARTAPARAPKAARPLRPLSAALGGLAAVAGLAGAFVAGRETGHAPAAMLAVEPAALGDAIQRAVAASSEPVRLGEDAVALEAGEAARMEGARVVALRASSLRWDDERSTVHMEGGAARFEVEPGRDRPFRVVSDASIVEVLGTVFVVDGGEVRVEKGRVRVATPDGDRVGDLGAGHHWSASAPADEAAPSAASVTPASVDPRALFARARRYLADGEAGPARALVQRATAQRLPPALEAEAQTLLAECALVSGDKKEAARRYAEVADKHGDLPAGEVALFAAARTAHANGQRAEARGLLQQYLAKYPKGRFVKEAQSRLTQLSP